MKLTPRQKAMRQVLLRARDEDRGWFEELVQCVFYDADHPKGTREEDTKALFHISEATYPSG